MIKSVRSKITSIIQSNMGRTLRFAAATAIGLIPPIGIVAGPVTGALDSFLIDKVFPNSGVVAFLTNTYPSLFVST